MSIRKPATLVACWFLLGILQLLGSYLDPRAAFGAAAAIGLLVFALARLFHLGLQRWWSPMLLAALSSLAGLGVRYLGDPASVMHLAWTSPLIAAATAGIVVLFMIQRPRCALCNRGFDRDLIFDCPRCGLRVCDRECWVFEQCRCRLCAENRVPIFSPDSRWWEAQLGPRVHAGRCQICLAVAAEVDLRACGQCGRPQCKGCWDFNNGACSRCNWVIDDLPPQLEPYIIRDDGGERPGRAERRQARYRL
ncbi:MAG: hypothetical protein AB1714_17730 [Acidobacteriota bacterium]